MSARRLNETVSWLGPIIATLLSVAFAIVGVYQFGHHQTTTVLENNLTGILKAGQDSKAEALAALVSTVDKAGYRIRVIRDGATPRKYSYLPQLAYVDVVTGDTRRLNRNTDRDDARAWRHGLSLPLHLDDGGWPHACCWTRGFTHGPRR